MNATRRAAPRTRNGATPGPAGRTRGKLYSGSARSDPKCEDPLNWTRFMLSRPAACARAPPPEPSKSPARTVPRCHRLPPNRAHAAACAPHRPFSTPNTAQTKRTESSSSLERSPRAVAQRNQRNAFVGQMWRPRTRHSMEGSEVANRPPPSTYALNWAIVPRAA